MASARGGHDHGDDHGSATERLFTLEPDPAGNPEGIAVDKKSRSFFVSIVADGDIYRGTLKSDTVEPFIDAADGMSAVGLKVKRGLLYVAGGATGTITVYDLDTKEAVATFETGTGGFLNDLVVTKKGDVYVTDSFRPTLWHVTREQVAAGSGTPQGIDLGEPIVFEPGEFNLNGIVAKSSRKLIVVDSNSGMLFRLKLNHDGDDIDEIDEIEGATVDGGDGMLLDRGKLVVVHGAADDHPAELVFLKLKHGARKAKIKRTQTSDKLRGPSTVDRAKGLYLVVNADFATSTKPFTVAGLPRNAKRDHGDDHGDDEHGDDDHDDHDNSGPGGGDDDHSGHDD